MDDVCSGDAMVLDEHVLKFLATIGAEALDLGMYAKSEQIFTALLPFALPRTTGASIGRAIALFHAGDTQAGIDILKTEALALDPACTDTLVQLAFMLRVDGKFEEAEQCIDASCWQSMDVSQRKLIEDVRSGRFDELVR